MQAKLDAKLAAIKELVDSGAYFTINQMDAFKSKEKAWTKSGFNEAVKIVLTEKNMLFESFSEKLINFPELDSMLRSLLFSGNTIAYHFYEPSINMATLFGLVKGQNSILLVANRIFETWPYNRYLSMAEMQKK